jgi:hypothetical protein
MLVITELLVALGILVVWLLVWDLVKHLAYEHVYAWVGLDELLELLENRVKILWVLVDMIDDSIEPFPVDSVITREPIAHSGWKMLMDCDRNGNEPSNYL